MVFWRMDAAGAFPIGSRRLQARLCTAAETLILRRGGLDFTMRDLAAEAGCSPMLPYRYYKDKVDIIAAVSRHGVPALCRRARGAAVDAGRHRRAIARRRRCLCRLRLRPPASLSVDVRHGAGGARPLSGARFRDRTGARHHDPPCRGTGQAGLLDRRAGDHRARVLGQPAWADRAGSSPDSWPQNRVSGSCGPRPSTRWSTDCGATCPEPRAFESRGPAFRSSGRPWPNRDRAAGA